MDFERRSRQQPVAQAQGKGKVLPAFIFMRYLIIYL
jgi:hypothetical protein